MTSRDLCEYPRPFAVTDSVCARSSPLSILSVGRDPEILARRERVITSDSALTVRSMNPEQAESWARAPEAYLWIFCRTVELPRLVYLASSVRRYSPASRLIVVQGSRVPGFEASLFHHIVAPGEETEVFLDAVTRLALGF